MIFQTVWIMVLLECTRTTLTLPFLHLASIPDFELQINTWMKHIDLWLKANNLSLNVANPWLLARSRNYWTIFKWLHNKHLWRWCPSKTKHLIANLLGLRTIISLGRPTNMTFQKKPPQTLVRLSELSHLFLCTMKLWYTKVLLNHALITVVLIGHGLCYRGAYLWNNLPEDVRTHSKLSRSDDLEGKFTLGLLIMLPNINYVKQFIEFIHILLLYECFNYVYYSFKIFPDSDWLKAHA